MQTEPTTDLQVVLGEDLAQPTESQLSEPNKLPTIDAELLIAELDATPIETDVETNKEAVEAAERSL